MPSDQTPKELSRANEFAWRDAMGGGGGSHRSCELMATPSTRLRGAFRVIWSVTDLC